MKALKIAWIAPLLFFSTTSFAQSHGHGGHQGSSGSSGGGGGSHASSDTGSRHHGGSSSGSSSGSSARAGGSTSSRDGGSANTSTPDAARRRPQPGTGTGDRYGGYRSRYVSPLYSAYYYSPYSYGFGYPRYGSYGNYGYGYGYYDYGYGYGDYSGYYPSYGYRTYRYREGNVAQVRTLVQPDKTRVYVDGYYAGIADDFDGLFQRLNVSPGRHEITLKLEGYNSHTFSIYASRDETLKLRWDMVRGNGETRDTIGAPLDRSPMETNRDADRDVERDRSTEGRYEPPSREPARPTGRGELFLNIEPGDASVYIDGEFYGKASEVSRLDLPAGRHRIEVVRPGYRTEETEVNIERESKRVTLKLERR